MLSIHRDIDINVDEVLDKMSRKQINIILLISYENKCVIL